MPIWLFFSRLQMDGPSKVCALKQRRQEIFSPHLKRQTSPMVRTCFVDIRTR
jgi:hypothetical protein